MMEGKALGDPKALMLRDEDTIEEADSLALRDTNTLLECEVLMLGMETHL